MVLVAPVPANIEIAEGQLLPQRPRDCRDCARDFAGDEGFASNRTLVVEENAGRGMQPARLPIIHGDPVRVELRGRIRRARIEWRLLVLWALPCLAEQLGRGSLIEAGRSLPAR